MTRFSKLAILVFGCLMVIFLSCSNPKQSIGEFPGTGWFYALREDSTRTYFELYLFESDSHHYWNLANEILGRNPGPWKVSQQDNKLRLEYHNDSTRKQEIEILEMTKQSLLLSSDGEPLRFFQIQEHFTEDEYLKMVNDTVYTMKLLKRAMERKGE